MKTHEIIVEIVLVARSLLVVETVALQANSGRGVQPNAVQLDFLNKPVPRKL